MVKALMLHLRQLDDFMQILHLLYVGVCLWVRRKTIPMFLQGKNFQAEDNCVLTYCAKHTVIKQNTVLYKNKILKQV